MSYNNFKWMKHTSRLCATEISRLREWDWQSGYYYALDQLMKLKSSSAFNTIGEIEIKNTIDFYAKLLHYTSIEKSASQGSRSNKRTCKKKKIKSEEPGRGRAVTKLYC